MLAQQAGMIAASAPSPEGHRTGAMRRDNGLVFTDSGLVFATRKGTPLDAQNIVNRHFKPLLKHAGLPLSAGTISVIPALLSCWGVA